MQIAIIGGGIAGLAAAWFLREHEVTVFEGSPRLGGKLRTIELAGLPVDVGAEAMLNRRPEAVELARDVGLGDRLVFPETTTAALWSRDALRPIPGGTLMGIPGDLDVLADSGVLSPEGLDRAREDLDLPGESVPDDVSIGTYAAERLGREVVDRLLEPLLGGVYAGHADRLSLQATIPQLAPYLKEDGSLIRAARKAKANAPGSDAPVFAGIDGGVGSLPAYVAEAAGCRLRMDSMIRAFCRTEKNKWRVTIGPTRNPEYEDFDALVIACPARPAGRLLAEVVPEAAKELASIEYASMATIAFALPRQELQGSGFLVPPVEAKTIKAATFSSSKWGWLADRNSELTVVRCSIGRQGEEALLQKENGWLIDAALADLRAATGISGTPVDAAVTRWGGGLPQYGVGHRALVGRVRAAVAGQPGLAVAGAAYDGVGIPACVASAKAAAQQVLQNIG